MTRIQSKNAIGWWACLLVVVGVAVLPRHGGLGVTAFSTRPSSSRRTGAHHGVVLTKTTMRKPFLPLPWIKNPGEDVMTLTTLCQQQSDDNDTDQEPSNLAEYLIPYALTTIAALAATALFFKFVLMDY